MNEYNLISKIKLPVFNDSVKKDELRNIKEFISSSKFLLYFNTNINKHHIHMFKIK